MIMSWNKYESLLKIVCKRQRCRCVFSCAICTVNCHSTPKTGAGTPRFYTPAPGRWIYRPALRDSVGVPLHRPPCLFESDACRMDFAMFWSIRTSRERSLPGFFRESIARQIIAEIRPGWTGRIRRRKPGRGYGKQKRPAREGPAGKVFIEIPGGRGSGAVQGCGPQRLAEGL